MSIKITNELLKKYANNECNPQERVCVEKWYNEYAASKKAKQLSLHKINIVNEEIWSSILSNIKQKPTYRLPFLKVAAAVVFLVGISFAIYKINNKEVNHRDGIQANFVSGKVRAEISVASNRSVVYDNSDIKKIMSDLKANQQMTIRTSVGEEYHAVLSDGSEIWLNANSEIIIPANYNDNYRDLNLLKGEAYFKVAKDKTRPFRVFASKTKIEALGTEFNVSYYGDNKSVKAFLVEGSISISKKNEQSVIKPNQLYQADDMKGISSVVEVEKPSTQYAWKSGYFEYSNTPLPEIIEDLSRWYNFNFEISPKYKDKTLTGKISRKQPFNEVLAILEFSGVKYRKEGPNLILEP